MSYPGPKKIIDVIDAMEHDEYLLPAIQREFVWKKDQICNLFDSLMNDYPIGSFLFWEVKETQYDDFEFYKFIKNYHQRDLRHNEKAGRPPFDKVIGILDGQQRLSAIFIGLKGSYTEKRKGSRRGADVVFDTKWLYCNLLSHKIEGQSEFEFDFLTESIATEQNSTTEKFWFKVKDILNFNEESELSLFLTPILYSRGQDNLTLGSRRLFKLYKVVNVNQIVNYYLETSAELDKILNIFVRANTGGTKLNYSDLLLSIATSQWQERDAREEITSFVDEINELGSGFNFTKDFVLRAALVLQDEFESIQFKADNFKRQNMRVIENNWDEISGAIKASINLVSKFGYQDRYLPQHLPIIPIAHYLRYKTQDFRRKLIERSQRSPFPEEYENIKQYLIVSMLKLVFSKGPEESLIKMREIIKNEHDHFPINTIKEGFTGIANSLYFNDDDIQFLLDYEYNDKPTFSILALFYPHYNFSNHFHIDHIYPETLFKKSKLLELGITDLTRQNRYIELFNAIPNLQLIEGQQNLEKSKKIPQLWLSEDFSNDNARNEYKMRHFIPQDIELTMENFETFFSQRNQLLLEQFKIILPNFIRQ
jgi:uncharacterized protein with ParB-like and HNH nuclease domain